MPTANAVLQGLNWPAPDQLGVAQWSVTDEETFTSTVASVHRTPDAVRARVFSQGLDGENKALFCAVWDVKDGNAGFKNHEIHGQTQPLESDQALRTFEGYLRTIAQAPRFTYTGDAPQTVGTVQETLVPVAQKAQVPNIPRRLFKV